MKPASTAPVRRPWQVVGSGFVGALSAQGDAAERLGQRDAIVLTDLCGSFRHTLAELVDVADLALVLGKRSDLLIERWADVDPVVGLLRAPKEDFPDLVGFQSFDFVLEVVEAVSRGWEDRIEDGSADGAMIWMIDSLVRVNAGWIVCYDGVGPDPPDLADDGLAKMVGWGELAILEVQEVDLFPTDLSDGVALLLFSNLGQALGCHVRVVTALVAAGTYEVKDFFAFSRPNCGGSSGAILAVVRVGTDYQDAGSIFGRLLLQRVLREVRCTIASNSIDGAAGLSRIGAGIPESREGQLE